MPRGGKRINSGRKPKNSKPYNELYTRVYVPTVMLDSIRRFTEKKGFTVPLYSSRVQAGTLEPADDAVEDNIDLNQYLVKDPENTFVVRATGESMIDAGIGEGDLLVVDRTIKPGNTDIIIALMEGQLTVKFLSIRGNKAYLMPANPAFKEIPVNEETGVTIQGVVTSTIKSFKHGR